MATTQTTTNQTVEVKQYYNRTLLSRLTPALVFDKYAQKKPMPKNNGKTVEFRRFNSLAPATTPLTEGVTPTGSSFTVAQVTATLAQYGDFIQTSDVLNDVAIDPVTTEVVELLGEQAGLTLDTVARDIISAGTTIQYAGAKTSTANITASDKLSYAEILKAVRTLKKNHAKPFEDGYYIGFIDAAQSYDLQQDSMWQDVSKYNGAKAIMEGEIGKIGKVRFIETENLKVKEGAGASSIDVHCALIIGKDSYGTVDLEGKGGVETIIKTPKGNDGNTNDPLNQRSTAGWKAMKTYVILQQLALLRLESAVSA